MRQGNKKESCGSVFIGKLRSALCKVTFAQETEQNGTGGGNNLEAYIVTWQK